jgi:uroporphyrinogen-III synthase
MRIASVGPSTATALHAEGATPDLVAGEHDAAGLAAAMLERGMAGATVWAPIAEAARDELAQRLGNAGATVRVQHIYRSVMPLHAPDDLRAALAGGVDAITLTSGSTARHLVEAMGSNPVPEGVVIVCIGEQTASEARAAGLTVSAIAPEASVAGLVRALTECLAPQPLR